MRRKDNKNECKFSFDFFMNVGIAGILLAATSLVAFTGRDIGKKRTEIKGEENVTE